MQQIPIKLGPLALLLTVISICLTTLSILTFSTSSADMRLAQRYAETVRERSVCVGICSMLVHEPTTCRPSVKCHR